jgi:hypothetical protein
VAVHRKYPGKVLCAYYDLGGEGVAYHDTDPKNHGSGELNPSDGTYLNEFRIHEGVDTSYTKFNRKPDPIDDNPFDKIVPPPDLLYVGWTEPGEWFNVTVDVAQSGTNLADFLYTSNRGGTISLDVNGKDATGPLAITTTNDPADPPARPSTAYQCSRRQVHRDRRRIRPALILQGDRVSLRNPSSCLTGRATLAPRRRT